MSEQNEPKSTEDMVNDLLGAGVQQEDKLASTEQPEEVVGSTGEVQKTQDQPQKPETDKLDDKGFASHPAWQAREQKLKEAREQLEAERATAQRYAKLLDELQRRQTQTQPSKEVQAQSIAEKACKKLGWDIARLTEDQRAYINDHVDLTMAAVGDYVTEQLDKRLGPMEQARQKWEAEQAMKQAESKWSSLAAEDGLDENVVKEAINRYCNELDKTDPERTQQFTDEDLYFRATRQLLREKEVSKVRQEARDSVKQNARPLGKGPATPTSGGPTTEKVGSREWIEAELSKRGIR